MALTHVTYEAAGWGVGEVWLDEGRLVWHELPRRAPSPAETNGHTALVDRFVAYFAGDPVAFDDVEVDDSWCTQFQRSVLQALRGVPRGHTVTYGEVAALAGRPNAQRAAGTFCAHNRFGLVVPCHRVVAADGLGSYGSLGQDYKRRLLELEGAL